MKKSLLIPALGLTTLLASSAAFSQEAYFFGDLGKSSYDLGGTAPGFAIEDTDTSIAIGFGFSFIDIFALEAGYIDLGETSISTISPLAGTYGGSSISIDGSFGLELDGFTFGAKVSAPINDDFSIYGRLGLFKWESDASFSGTVIIDGTSYTDSGSAKLDDGNDPYFGVGAEFTVTDNLSLGLAFTRYSIDLLDASEDVDNLTIGITYKN